MSQTALRLASFAPPNVGGRVVADMPDVLWFNAKRAEGDLKDPRIGLRNADLTRDHDCAETILDVQDRQVLAVRIGRTIRDEREGVARLQQA